VTYFILAWIVDTIVGIVKHLFSCENEDTNVDTQYMPRVDIRARQFEATEDFDTFVRLPADSTEEDTASQCRASLL
jgi:hypothetical protein